MTRIIGGAAGGRRLRTPPGAATRPTSDRVREALFSSLEARLGTLTGLRVLDLYAGSGALGFEAWSRGAEVVTFVEQDRRTARLIAGNARSLGCRSAEVVTGAVAAVLGRGPGPEPDRASYDLVLSDPPYPLSADAVAADLALLRDHGWLADGALLVVERSARGAELPWPEGYDAARARRYGETLLYYGSYQPQPDEEEEHS
ncbi:MAG: 16S rRNA (guanine(966)-N(2))-methyltransferase RsmD [Gemmatimonadetes bacterium]|nr:16S rRNA (guanine(966)-N(2))-methyltransferase RsmD [Gemmatimonadota bacterium]